VDNFDGLKIFEYFRLQSLSVQILSPQGSLLKGKDFAMGWLFGFQDEHWSQVLFGGAFGYLDHIL
jgi:hypothetical protein